METFEAVLIVIKLSWWRYALELKWLNCLFNWHIKFIGITQSDLLPEIFLTELN